MIGLPDNFQIEDLTHLEVIFDEISRFLLNHDPARTDVQTAEDGEFVEVPIQFRSEVTYLM